LHLLGKRLLLALLLSGLWLDPTFGAVVVKILCLVIFELFL